MRNLHESRKTLLFDLDKSLLTRYLIAEGKEKKAIQKQIAENPDVILDVISEIRTTSPNLRTGLYQQMADAGFYRLLRDTSLTLLSGGMRLERLEQRNKLLSTMQIIGMLDSELEYKGSRILIRQNLERKLREIKGVNSLLLKTAMKKHNALLARLDELRHHDNPFEYARYQDISGRFEGMMLYRDYNEARARQVIFHLQRDFDLRNTVPFDDTVAYEVVNTNPRLAYGGYNAAEYILNPELVEKSVLLAAIENVGSSYVLFTPSNSPTKDLRLYMVDQSKGKEGERQLVEQISNSDYRIVDGRIVRAESRVKCVERALQEQEKGVTPAFLGSDWGIQMLDVLGFRRLPLRLGGMGVIAINQEILPQIMGFVKALLQSLNRPDAIRLSRRPEILLQNMNSSFKLMPKRLAMWENARKAKF